MNQNNFSPEELIRYSRHFPLSQIGMTGQEKLKSARVLCIGAGGLGSPLLLYLTAAGVGTLGIVDDDVIDLSNLQRQVLYSSTDINITKTLVAKEKLQTLNPNINIVLHDKRLTEKNAFDIISQYDLIADGTDNFVTRYLINDVCFHLKKPNVFASIFQFEGQCSVFTAEDGPCYRCLFDAPPPNGLIPSCAEGGVLGVLPGVMGSLQATEILKLILGIGTPLIGRLLQYDALKMKFQEFPILKNPECRLCKYQQPFQLLPRYQTEVCNNPKQEHEKLDSISVDELKNLMELKSNFILLDVREPYEYDIANLGATLIPLGQLSQNLGKLDKSKLIIVHCKVGARSQEAAKLLKHAGFSVKYLAGGITAWSINIDRSIAQY